MKKEENEVKADCRQSAEFWQQKAELCRCQTKTRLMPATKQKKRNTELNKLFTMPFRHKIKWMFSAKPNRAAQLSQERWLSRLLSSFRYNFL
jgi:hypothetical protein